VNYTPSDDQLQALFYELLEFLLSIREMKELNLPYIIEYKVFRYKLALPLQVTKPSSCTVVVDTEATMV
jgi:hypothetical protein